MLRVTDETFPVICLQTAGRITLADIQRVHPIYERAYAAGRPLVAINDARHAHHDAAQRKLWAEWTAQCSQLDQGVTRATIIILDSALLRGALTALNWLSPRALPQVAVADAAEAIDVARFHVERESLRCGAETWARVHTWLSERAPDGWAPSERAR
jgi:hypothetical protein